MSETAIDGRTGKSLSGIARTWPLPFRSCAARLLLEQSPSAAGPHAPAVGVTRRAQSAADECVPVDRRAMGLRRALRAGMALRRLNVDHHRSTLFPGMKAGR